uniref:Rubis-subs-bind domain-containing protein n=1 Tax=Gongylonema pulchrum TaxID=637853 RepID=A0A183D339_9BILA
LSARKEADETNTGAVLLKLDNVENDVPTVACYKLTAIAAPLMNHLKAMMQELADGTDRAGSEETLAEGTECKQLISDAEAERRKRLQTKRQRNTAVTLSAAFLWRELHGTPYRCRSNQQITVLLIGHDAVWSESHQDHSNVSLEL